VQKYSDGMAGGAGAELNLNMKRESGPGIANLYCDQQEQTVLIQFSRNILDKQSSELHISNIL